MHLSSVDLPDPFSPISPNVEPCGISKETSRSAQNSSNEARLPRIRAALIDWLRSRYIRNRLETPSTLTAVSVTVPPRFCPGTC